MDTLINKLFVIPMSWLLAVPIVLLDRLLAPELPATLDWDESCTTGASF